VSERGLASLVPMGRRAADDMTMRSRRVVTALVVTAVGLTATAALRRLRGRRATTARTVDAPVPVVPAADREAVILAFARPRAVPVASAAAAPAASVVPAASVAPVIPARCGDNGGRTKAGAPCAARATSAGRCHHHRVAA
jgi:hypothetical protein